MQTLPFLIIVPALLVTACGTGEELYDTSVPSSAATAGGYANTTSWSGNGGSSGYSTQGTLTESIDRPALPIREASPGASNIAGAAQTTIPMNGASVGSSTSVLLVLDSSDSNCGGSPSVPNAGTGAFAGRGGSNSYIGGNLVRVETDSSLIQVMNGIHPIEVNESRVNRIVGPSSDDSFSTTTASETPATLTNYDLLPCLANADCAQDEACSSTNVSAELLAAGVGLCIAVEPDQVPETNDTSNSDDFSPTSK